MKNRFLRYVVALGLATFLSGGGLSTSKAHGEIIGGEFSYTLAYLLDNPSITLQVADKLFSGFSAVNEGIVISGQSFKAFYRLSGFCFRTAD